MVFLDTNVILEVVLKNRPHFQAARNFLENIEEATAVSMLSVHLIMYFGHKERAEEAYLQGVIGANELLALTPEDYTWAAFNERGKDFEDALQVAVAVRSGCDAFVTLDRALAKAYTGLPLNIIVI